MKNKLISIMLLTALTCMVGSCDKDETTNVTPMYLQTGTDARPSNWTLPNASLYEFRMSVQVQLGDTLSYFQSSQDLMCATINGEIRAVTPPCNTGGIIYYPLIIFDNGTSSTVSLRYYCDRLRRIYTITNWSRFNATVAPTGNNGIYRPCFTAEYK